MHSEIDKFNQGTDNKIVTLDKLDLFNDFDRLAAVLMNLDLFISVSNSTAHLAGSLGVKTILIKPKIMLSFIIGINQIIKHRGINQFH